MNKNKSFITLLVCILSLTLLGSSCSDMLEPKMDRYAQENSYVKDSVYSAFGILKSIQSVAGRSVILDASRSDLVASGTYTTDSIMQLIDFSETEDGSCKLLNVADFYHIINSCNYYIANVDTVFSKNGYAEMKREYAAVQAIRGWAYLQLVRLYGTVPFITKPVRSTSDANEQENSAPSANAENVADLLIDAGLLDAYTIQRSLGLPNYSNISNGIQNYSTTQCFFPAQLILGDAYLMQNKYDKAAEMYYDYFERYYSDNNNNTYYSMTNAMRTQGVITGYNIIATQWMNAFRNNARSEKVVVSVGAANSFFGQVMTDVHHIYGFSTSSRQGGSGSSASGSTSVTASEEYQQILPSQQYISLNQNQNFNRYVYDNEVMVRETIEGGDGRLYATAPTVEFRNGNQTRIIDKFTPVDGNSISSLNTVHASPNSFSMVYEIPLYRNPQIWLRYAEAINRMGFPQLAFGVLKDGLFNQNLPTVRRSDLNYYALDSTRDTIGVVIYDTIPVTTIDPATGDSITHDSIAWTLYRYADGYTPDSSKMNVPSLVAPTALSGGMYYVTLDEMLRAENYSFLDFKKNTAYNVANLTSTTPASRYGIHGRGCGVVAGKYDTIYTYAKMVAKKIAENYARENNLSYADQLAYEETLHSGDTLLVTDKELIINAVEDLIVDEGALETAFEGYRFGDLMRIASHKDNGVQWLAWKIARRDYNVTDDAQQKDEALYSKLLNKNNWFYTLPKK